MQFVSGLQGVKAVAFDIDGTIASSTLGYADVGYFEYVLAALLSRINSIALGEALEQTLSAERQELDRDPFRAARALDVPLALYRRELAEVQRRHLVIHSDAVRLVRFLKARGYALVVATNNTESRAWAVLRAAGLSGWAASRYFDAVYTSGRTGCRKSDPAFYRALMADSGFKARELLVVGDSVKDDRLSPRAAGIGRSVIVNRDKRAGGQAGIMVRDLMAIVKHG